MARMGYAPEDVTLALLFLGGLSPGEQARRGSPAEPSPVEVRRADGSPLQGEVMYQLNKTKDGWVVMLVNNNGVDKTQNGVARVDRLEP